MTIKNKFLFWAYFVISILMLNAALSLPFISMTDDWSTDAGTTTDQTIFVDKEIKPETLDISDLDADFVCYDWNDDDSYDNCYYDSNGCGSSCNSESCNFYAIPSNMNDNWKASCDIDGGSGTCRIGEDVTSRICATCDGVDTSTEQQTFMDAAIYYDCDNSNNNRHVDSLDPDEFFVVKPKAYDCDGCDWYTQNCPDYDFEGDYSTSGASWLDITANVDCFANDVCDENHDDVLINTATGSIPNPCRRDLGDSCSVDDDCASDICNDVWDLCGDCEDDNDCNDPSLPYCLSAICNCGDDPDFNGQCDSCLGWTNGHSCDCSSECQSGNCAGGVCTVATETSCTDSSDNDGDGSTDCDDSDCEGQSGPGGKVCCNDGAFNCGTCKYCSSDLCENRAVGFVCNNNYFCSDFPGGDNSYNTGSSRKIPSQGQCDSSQNCDYSSSSPACDLAEGGNQEGSQYDICQDSFSSCRDTCSDGIDNDGDGNTDSADSSCNVGNCNNNGICDSGETTSSCSSDCKSTGSSCSYDSQCFSGICVCSVCRGAYTYYTSDGCCNTALGETCSNSPADCGSCNPLISVPSEIIFEVG